MRAWTSASAAARRDDWSAYREIRLRMLADSPGRVRLQLRPRGPACPRSAGASGRATRCSSWPTRPTSSGWSAPPPACLRRDRHGRRRGDVRRPPRSAVGAAPSCCSTRWRRWPGSDGARRVVLHVTAGNEAATRCYTRYGFARPVAAGRWSATPSSVEVELRPSDASTSRCRAELSQLAERVRSASHDSSAGAENVEVDVEVDQVAGRPVQVVGGQGAARRSGPRPRPCPRRG